MTTTLTLFALLVAVALLSNPCGAQQSVRTTSITGGTDDNRFEREVVAALKARLGGTTRYQVIASTEVAELEVSVVCIDLSESNRLNGGFCSYAFTYWPKEAPGLSRQLGPIHLLSDPNASSAGETVFQKLVEASSEAKLAVSLKEMETSAELYVLLRNPTKSTKPTKP